MDYYEYNSSRYLISTIIKMWAATLFAGYKCIGVQMLIKSTFSEVDFLLEMR